VVEVHPFIDFLDGLNDKLLMVGVFELLLDLDWSFDFAFLDDSNVGRLINSIESSNKVPMRIY
jgi:hypothetical protein